MTGTTKGGKKIAHKLTQRDPDYYRKLGAKGGKKTGAKGLAATPAKVKRKIQSMGGKAKASLKKVKLDGYQDVPPVIPELTKRTPGPKPKTQRYPDNVLENLE